MTIHQQHAFPWQPSSGRIECYEVRIATSSMEYIRGVVIAQEGRVTSGGYTAYIEYFKHGFARQQWAGQIFPTAEQAQRWCENEITQLQSR